jgi:2-alkenal reductase
VPTLAPELTNALEEEQRVLIELYKRVNQAVVAIEVIVDHPEVEGSPLSGQALPLGQGSGFLFDDQGHIVTNDHVIDEGKGFQVRFADGTVLEATLVGRDAGSDLAILKVDQLPANTAPLTLANSQSVEVGQTTIAIGNPFGLQNTLTVGVVSGIGRSLSGPSSPQGGRFSIPNVIQTDAAINPGNSGGPLLNIRGEVIGVNTAIRSESGRFEGIGYAVPSNAVLRVAPALIANGTYEHPWMGIGMCTVEPIMARQFNFVTSQAVLVSGVLPDSPAERAGLRAGNKIGEYPGCRTVSNGDIITAVNGQTVRSSDDLISYLQENAKVGDTITFTVLRNGEQAEVQLTLAARPNE